MEHGPHGAETLAGLMRDVFDPLIRSVYELDGFVPTLAGDAFTAVFAARGDSEPERQDAAARAVASAWQIQQRMAAAAWQRTPYGEFDVSAKVGAACGEVNWGIVSSEDQMRATYYFEGPAIDSSAQAEHAASAGEIIYTASLHDYVGDLAISEPSDDGDKQRRLLALGPGAPTGRPVSLPPVDYEVMTHFFPPGIVTQERSGEFRQVLTLFISLPTIRTEDQLAIFMRSIFTLQDRYGGLLNRVDFGDKGSNLLLFWGAPVAHENDVARTLNFVLDLQANTSIPINAGVTYRIAHAGFVGSPLREEFTCYGRGVNLAARFMTAAPRGEIWLDEHVARLADKQFDIDFEDEMAFKGFADKQKVYVLFEAKEEGETLYDGLMVGRKAEMEALAEFVEPLWHGEPAGTVIIWGESGMGKSRLVYEFRGREVIAQASVLWAFCQSDEILRESFNPFRYWLKGYFGQSTSQSEPRNKRNFNRKLDSLIADTGGKAVATELDRTRSFLGAMLDLYWPDSLYAGLDASARYENTMLGLLALMQAESLRQPVVIQIEDTQWIDDASREFMVRLARAMKPGADTSYPIAVIVTSRREGPGCPLAEDDRCLEIDLAQLPRDSLRELAQEMLGGVVSEPLLDLVVIRAEGNPFFAEQILRYLQESDLLLDRPDGWQSKRELRRLLPDDVRSVLIARLDRLAEEVKGVVQTASVLGREFEISILINMLHDDPLARERIDTAEQAAIWSALSQLRYLFKHALLRDTAYHMQVRARRSALHMLAVEALETLYADDLRPHYGQLGYHSQYAGLDVAAADWYLLAADEAINHGTLFDALNYYNQAESVLPEETPDRRWRVLIQQAKVLAMQGDTDGSMDKSMQALALAKDVNDYKRIAEAHLYLANAASITGDDQTALAELDATLAASRRCGSKRFEALSLGMRTITLARMGRMDDAAIVAEGALVIAEALDNEQALVRVLTNLAQFHSMVGDYGRAADLLDQQVEINRRRGDQVGVSYGLTNLAYNQLLLGQYEAAREAIAQALQLTVAMGAKRLGAYNHLNLGLAETRLGRSAEARQEIETARQVMIEVDDKFGIAASHSYLGFALENENQWEDAADSYEVAARMMQEIGTVTYATDARAGQARCVLLCGNKTLAERLADEVWVYLRQSGPGGLEFPSLAFESCALVLANTGDQSAYRAAVKAGHDELLERAQKISDGEWRNSFLSNVPEHSTLIERWKELAD